MTTGVGAARATPFYGTFQPTSNCELGMMCKVLAETSV